MQSIWRPGLTLEDVRRSIKDTMAEHLQIQLTELGTDFLAAIMPVTARSCQPARALHGGASAAFAETLGSLGANFVLQNPEERCVGQEINANHLRPVFEGAVVRGVARPFHIGSRSHVWSIEIFDDRSRLICVSRLTLAVVKIEMTRPPRNAPATT